MKTFNLILYIIACIFTFNANAQSSPGYLGKKFLLEYKCELNKLSLGDQNIDISLGDGETLSRLDNFEFGYVLTRGTTLGLRYAQMNSIETIGTSATVDYKYRIIGLNSYFHYFRSRGHIAPLGNFFNLEILYTNFDLINSSGIENLNDIGFGIGVGNRFIFADRISFSQEFKFTHFVGLNTFFSERIPGFTAKLGLGLLLF